MCTVLLVVHGDLGLYYSHVTMERRRFCIMMQLRGVDKADGVHATNFGDGLCSLTGYVRRESAEWIPSVSLILVLAA